MRRLLFVFVALGMLVACGGATANVPTVARSQPTPNTPTTVATNQEAATAGTYNGVPTSRTAEGYHVLGDSNAPITIEHFSDFL